MAFNTEGTSFQRSVLDALGLCLPGAQDGGGQTYCCSLETSRNASWEKHQDTMKVVVCRSKIHGLVT